jgi:ribosomal protein L21E
MEIKDDVLKKEHDKYNEFELSQFTANLAKGDIIEIKINGELIKSYIVKYINCHINATIQDKGEKIDT